MLGHHIRWWTYRCSFGKSYAGTVVELRRNSIEVACVDGQRRLLNNWQVKDEYGDFIPELFQDYGPPLKE